MWTSVLFSFFFPLSSAKSFAGSQVKGGEGETSPAHSDSHSHLCLTLIKLLIKYKLMLDVFDYRRKLGLRGENPNTEQRTKHAVYGQRSLVVELSISKYKITLHTIFLI